MHGPTFALVQGACCHRTRSFRGVEPTSSRLQIYIHLVKSVERWKCSDVFECAKRSRGFGPKSNDAGLSEPTAVIEASSTTADRSAR